MPFLLTASSVSPELLTLLYLEARYLAVWDGIDHEHGDGGEDSADVKDVDDVPLVASLVGVGVDSGRVDSEPPPRPKLQMKGW